MILFYNPKATRSRNRRLPLSVLAIAAVIEGKEEYAIVDGNLDPNPTQSLITLIEERPIELLAVTVMPGAWVSAGKESRPSWTCSKRCAVTVTPTTFPAFLTKRPMGRNVITRSVR